MKPVFYPIIDNGMGLSVTAWAFSMLVANAGPRQFIQVSGPYCGYCMDISTHYFLKSECDEMVVIDTDIVFTPAHIKMLMEHDEPLVFGVYPKRMEKLEFPIVSIPENPKPFENEGPLCEVMCAARGFMRVHRSVFEKMKPLVATHKDGHHGEYSIYWPLSPGEQSEDFAFCKRWRELGGKILIDKRILLRHSGQILYPVGITDES